MPPNGTGLTITNPLVLYRSLIATNRIQPDPSQHRLALHLQKLYERLIDYEPSIEYSHRLRQLSRAVSAGDEVSSTSIPDDRPIGTRGIWTSLLAQKEKRDSLALTRVFTSHEAAMNLQSPKGLMLHGDVGTGKSMLIDLFADCLPNRKKRRWHFNTFMLDTFSKLESMRKSRSLIGPGNLRDEYSLLWLARDLIQKSPILFLDEFQLPDRAASKILSNLMTSFFQLGGVVIATSNRMPEELAKAAGIEFARPVSRLSRLGWSLGLNGAAGRDDGPGQKGEFAQFLDVLRARCEIWEMEGKRDYRRISGEEEWHKNDAVRSASHNNSQAVAPKIGQPSLLEPGSRTDSTSKPESIDLPKNYFVQPSPSTDLDTTRAFTSNLTIAIDSALLRSTHPIHWTLTTLTVYGRKLSIPRQYSGTTLFTFSELCGATLGPADYITIASTYHTLILTEVPILTFLQKNEARRFITLLDALYEARCRLLITAAAGPDDIFFPESPNTPSASPTASKRSRGREVPELGAIAGPGEELADDAVHPETYSEIHQDLTSPFRPNISSYSPSTSSTLAEDALEDDPPNRVRRPGSSFTDERRLKGSSAKGPDFANIGGLTGEDERFAVKRARSRIWEMCSSRWWARGKKIEEWWRPLPLESRHWERSPSQSLDRLSAGDEMVETDKSSDGKKIEGEKGVDAEEDMFAHGASPFRTTSDPPPRINWTHVWGTMKWGKRAGAWGKGAEGLEERRGKIESKSEAGDNDLKHRRD